MQTRRCEGVSGDEMGICRDKPEHTRDGGHKHGEGCGCVPPKVVR